MLVLVQCVISYDFELESVLNSCGIPDLATLLLLLFLWSFAALNLWLDFRIIEVYNDLLPRIHILCIYISIYNNGQMNENCTSRSYFFLQGLDLKLLWEIMVFILLRFAVSWINFFYLHSPWRRSLLSLNVTIYIYSCSCMLVLFVFVCLCLVMNHIKSEVKGYSE